MVATDGPGELLFAALDAGELSEANDILDRNPVDLIHETWFLYLKITGKRRKPRWRTSGKFQIKNKYFLLQVPLHYAADCADLGTFQRIFSQ